MDIVEYAEKVYNITLLDYQKQLLRAAYDAAKNGKQLYYMPICGVDRFYFKTIRTLFLLLIEQERGVVKKWRRNDMRGYKVYFDGEKFAVESELSKVVPTPYDSPVCWCAGPELAFIQARDQNELIRQGKWTVQACKNCGECFLLMHAEITWFQEHGMKPPKRCRACRKERKNEQRRG